MLLISQFQTNRISSHALRMQVIFLSGKGILLGVVLGSLSQMISLSGVVVALTLSPPAFYDFHFFFYVFNHQCEVVMEQRWRCLERTLSNVKFCSPSREEKVINLYIMKAKPKPKTMQTSNPPDRNPSSFLSLDQKFSASSKAMEKPPGLCESKHMIFA